MVRGTSSTAFRAPSTADLFSGRSDNSPTVVDPCFSNPTSFCIADGVPAAGFEPIGDQLSSTRGGNTELTPEEADIFTLGFVWSPEAVEGLSFTVDYWDIEVTNAIATLGEQLILTSCANSGTYCDKITRFGPDSPLYGNSIDIDDRNINVGGVDSSGIDFNVRYTTDIELGQLTVNTDATRYETYDITQADGTVIENAHRYLDDNQGGHGNFPEWKINVDVSLATDDWSVNWATRFIDSVDEPYAPAASGERAVGTQVIHDARFTYFMDNVTVSVGLNNILDEDPPFLNTGFNDNTDPRTYDTTGRHAYVSLGLKF
jgi:outer membrane cobalamin receptor